jgi:hypothetical protein
MMDEEQTFDEWMLLTSRRIAEGKFLATPAETPAATTHTKAAAGPVALYAAARGRGGGRGRGRGGERGGGG